MPSQAVKPAQKTVVQKKPAPDKTKGLRLLKETPQASIVQKKTCTEAAPDKVEKLAKEYFVELKEVDETFEKGTAVLEKYRAKYPELASYIREIVPGERRIEMATPRRRGSNWIRGSRETAWFAYRVWLVGFQRLVHVRE